LAAIPIEFPFWMKFDLDGRVIGFTVGVSLLTSLVFGAAPALLALRIELNEVLKEGGRSGANPTRQRLRGALVVVEVALSLVLLIGAGLMMRSFLRLQSVHPGFNPERVLADEPTGNLDSTNGEAVMDLLRELHRGGATICMVTHDARFAKDADRSIHLFDGRIVEEGQNH
jgi:hypothetical protein